MAGAVLWVLRARFLRFEVRLFGTAMGRKEVKESITYEVAADQRVLPPPLRRFCFVCCAGVSISVVAARDRNASQRESTVT